MQITINGGVYLDLTAVWHEALEEFLAKQDITEHADVKLTLEGITIKDYANGGKRNFMCNFTANLLDVSGEVVVLPVEGTEGIVADAPKETEGGEAETAA